MPSLLERQVKALRESVKPGGRWDRLASGKVYSYPDACELCLIATRREKIDDFFNPCSVCPLKLATQWCDDKNAIYWRWSEARTAAIRSGVGGYYGFNAPEVVALAREMKALLERLLDGYTAKLWVEEGKIVTSAGTAATCRDRAPTEDEIEYLCDACRYTVPTGSDCPDPEQEPCAGCDGRSKFCAPTGDELMSLKSDLAAARGANLVLDERAGKLELALEEVAQFTKPEPISGDGDGMVYDIAVDALDEHRKGME